MKLFSTDDKPLTPKARAKVDAMLFEASVELTEALVDAKGVHTSSVRDWDDEIGMYEHNPYRRLFVRDYGTWRDRAYKDATDEEWNQGYAIEDNDFMALTTESSNAIDAVIKSFSKRYKKLEIDWSESEKCLLVFRMSIANPNEPAI